MAGYQVLATWIPFKWNVSYNYLFDRNWSAELVWSRGSYGIGAFNDFRIVKDAIQKVKNIPTFILLGLNLGYSF